MLTNERRRRRKTTNLRLLQSPIGKRTRMRQVRYELFIVRNESEENLMLPEEENDKQDDVLKRSVENG